MTKFFEQAVERVIERVLDKKNQYNPDEYITRKELSERWRTSTKSITRYTKRENYNKPLPYYMTGREHTFIWREANEWARKNLRVVE